MRFTLRSRRTETSLDLAAGHLTIGGGVGDDIRVDGLSASLLSLEVGQVPAIRATRLLRLGRGMLSANARRLLLPGEKVILASHVSLERPAEPSLNASALARSLLRGNYLGPRLTCVQGDDAGAVFLLFRTKIVVGRAAGAQVQLKDADVAQRHALLARASACVVRPLDGQVWLNGERVAGDQEVQLGDVLRIGSAELVYS